VSEVVDNNAGTASSMSDAASAHEINLEEEFKQVRTSFLQLIQLLAFTTSVDCSLYAIFLVTL
jgi:hypothetical protein